MKDVRFPLERATEKTGPVESSMNMGARLLESRAEPSILFSVLTIYTIAREEGKTIKLLFP